MAFCINCGYHNNLEFIRNMVKDRKILLIIVKLIFLYLKRIKNDQVDYNTIKSMLKEEWPEVLYFF